MKKLKKYRGRKAVSPVVATLILIIVAIVGAVAVGLIVSGIGSQTSKNANVGNVQNQAQTQILIGGSTTLYPAVSAAATAYNAANGVNIQVQQGGSGAGMEGVAEGVLDIGDASSFSAVATAISQYPSANLQPFEMGGSGVVAIENGGSGAPITATDECVEFTQGAMNVIYTDGVVSLACPATGIVTSTDVTAAVAGCTAGPTCVTAVSRSDLPSGTEDTWCAFINTAPGATGPCQTTSNNAVALSGVTAVGNPGVLAYVQSHSYTIGFVDLGFAEGAGAELAQSVFIPQLTTNAVGLTPTACNAGSAAAVTATPLSTATGASNCFVANGESTSNLHTFIGNSLSGSGSTIYPDYANTNGATGLTRTFWMVTSGQPSTLEQAFITYLRSPSATTFWNNAGYFSLYQITPITPP